MSNEYYSVFMLNVGFGKVIKHVASYSPDFREEELIKHIKHKLYSECGYVVNSYTHKKYQRIQ